MMSCRLWKKESWIPPGNVTERNSPRDSWHIDSKPTRLHPDDWNREHFMLHLTLHPTGCVYGHTKREQMVEFKQFCSIYTAHVETVTMLKFAMNCAAWLPKGCSAAVDHINKPKHKSDEGRTCLRCFQRTESRTGDRLSPESGSRWKVECCVHLIRSFRYSSKRPLPSDCRHKVRATCWNTAASRPLCSDFHPHSQGFITSVCLSVYLDKYAFKCFLPVAEKPFRSVYFDVSILPPTRGTDWLTE